MHVDFSDIKIKDFYVHRVGNKANDEALVLAAGAADADDEVKAALLQMFTSPFRSRKSLSSLSRMRNSAPALPRGSVSTKYSM